MTRNRRHKQDVRAAAAQSGDRYARARRQPAPAALKTYTGEILICSSCAQPAYNTAAGPQHFSDQTNGVFCPAFPAASGLLPMDWDDFSLDHVRDGLSWRTGAVDAVCRDTHTSRERFQDSAGPMRVCTSCGQPAFNGYYGPEHFMDQWDGVHCNQYPLAGRLVQADWDERSVADWKARYPCSYPHYSLCLPADSA